MHRNKAEKWHLDVGQSLIWKDIEEQGLKYIRDYYEKIDKTVLCAVRIKLKERGYDFNSDNSFMNFIKNELEFVRNQLLGQPLNSTLTVYLMTGEPIVAFDFKTEYTGLLQIEMTIKMRDDISNIPYRKISSLRGKMTKQTAEEIDKQIEGLRNEWERDV